MATRHRCIVLLFTPVLVFGIVYAASAASRPLTVWRGDPDVLERSGQCLLGAWSRAAEGLPWPRVTIHAGVLAPQSCEPVEIKVEVTLWRKKKPMRLNAREGKGTARLNRWKVVPLSGPQTLKRGSVQVELDLDSLPWPLEPGEPLNVKVTTRCKHGTTVVSDAWYRF